MSNSAIPLRPVQSSGQIVTLCRCDDVSGDQSNIVQYYHALSLVNGPNGLQVDDLGAFTDDTLQTAYTPTNPVECETLGDLAKCKQGLMTILPGGAWSPTDLTRSYSVRVLSIGDANSPPEFVDSFGQISSLIVGEVVEFDCGENFIDTNVSVLARSAHLKITFTELGT